MGQGRVFAGCQSVGAGWHGGACPPSHDAVNGEAHFRLGRHGATPQHRRSRRHRTPMRRMRSSIRRAPITGAAQAVCTEPMFTGHTTMFGTWRSVVKVSIIPDQPFSRRHKSTISVVPQTSKIVVSITSNLHLHPAIFFKIKN